ncbi:hypothetical protein D3C77_660780 [compost metagenome]
MKPPAMVRFFINISWFTPSAKLVWNSSAVRMVKPAVNSATVRVRKPNRIARPPPNSSRMVSGSKKPGTPIDCMYCWVPA